MPAVIGVSQARNGRVFVEGDGGVSKQGAHGFRWARGGGVADKDGAFWVGCIAERCARDAGCFLCADEAEQFGGPSPLGDRLFIAPFIITVDRVEQSARIEWRAHAFHHCARQHECLCNYACLWTLPTCQIRSEHSAWSSGGVAGGTASVDDGHGDPTFGEGARGGGAREAGTDDDGGRHRGGWLEGVCRGYRKRHGEPPRELAEGALLGCAC